MNESSPLLGARNPNVANKETERSSDWTMQKLSKLILLSAICAILCIALVFGLSAGVRNSLRRHSMLGAAWSSRAAPFSTVDPATLGIQYIERPKFSQPGKAFNGLVNRSIPLPTNAWYEDFLIGSDNTVPESNVFQVPYIIDTSGHIVGVRTHPCHVQANSKMVMVSELLV